MVFNSASPKKCKQWQFIGTLPITCLGSPLLITRPLFKKKMKRDERGEDNHLAITVHENVKKKFTLQKCPGKQVSVSFSFSVPNQSIFQKIFTLFIKEEFQEVFCFVDLKMQKRKTPKNGPFTKYQNQTSPKIPILHLLLLFFLFSRDYEEPNETQIK